MIQEQTTTEPVKLKRKHPQTIPQLIQYLNKYWTQSKYWQKDLCDIAPHAAWWAMGVDTAATATGLMIEFHVDGQKFKLQFVHDGTYYGLLLRTVLKHNTNGPVLAGPFTNTNTTTAAMVDALNAGILAARTALLAHKS